MKRSDDSQCSDRLAATHPVTREPLRTSEPQNLRTSEPQNLRTSEPQNLRTSEPQNLRTSEPQNLRTSEPQNLRTSEPQNLRTSEPQNLRTSEPQNLRTSEPQNLRTSEPQNLRTSEPLARARGSSRRAFALGSLSVGALTTVRCARHVRRPRHGAIAPFRSPRFLVPGGTRTRRQRMKF